MHSTVKHGNKGHSRQKHIMAVIDKWSLFGGFVIFLISEGLSECELYLQDGLYSVTTLVKRHIY